jgi:hypothetical protein
MAQRLRSFSFLLIAVVAVVAVAAGSVTAADSPTATVTVAREPVADGTTTTVASDPTVEVNATVPADAPANVTVSEIIVFVDSSRRKVFDVDARSVARETTLSLSEGNHTVRIVVTDSSGTATSTEFTVRKDATAPLVFLSEPYETKPFYDVPDGNVSGGTVTVAGEFIEDGSIESATLSYEHGNYSGTDRLDTSDGNFSTTIRLPRGKNDLKITTTDDLGNSRIDQFDFNVTDGGPPNLTIQKRNRTTVPELIVPGTVTDDMWVRSVNVTVEERTTNGSRSKYVVEQRSFDETVDRRTVSFNGSILLMNATTYDVTVNATDADGNTVTETYTTTWTVPEDDVVPNVTVDETGTVYVTGDAVLVQGAVIGGEIDRVDIETRYASNDSAIAFETVHSGETTDSVDIARQVPVGPTVSKVVVSATDSEGGVHTESFYVDADAGETFVGPDGATPDPEEPTSDPEEPPSEPDGPTVSITTLSDGDATTASATATVSEATVGENVTLPPADGNRTAVASTANLTVSAIDLRPRSANFTLYVRADEDGTAAVPNATTAGTVSIDHPANLTDENVTLRVRANDTYLSTAGVDPSNATIYRRSDGNWSTLPTTHEGRVDGDHAFSAVSPGLSSFALGAPAANDTQDDDETSADDEAAASEDDEAAASEEDGESGGGSAAEANITVTDVETNATRISPNGTVVVDATLENEGAANGTFVAGLRLNDSTVATQLVRVEANDSATVTFERQVAEQGNYSVAVNGTSGGYLVVGNRGLLGSLWATVTGFVPAWLGGPFAGLPLGLIAQAVVGLVAVIVAASILLRVLKRVRGGGEGESS